MKPHTRRREAYARGSPFGAYTKLHKARKAWREARLHETLVRKGELDDGLDGATAVVGSDADSSMLPE